ncbi:hypothetical protein [Polynucleobacter sp. AP-Reno-20A-A9]|uniref:hypothetical protein n=1 Tax=Polynucleobacter sp. AP-Reno-20A-A9 TaxID=2576925 RepID=UPI001C0B84D0|nr:hypothetical protein [Polynucleobacter sp. AP-Reno-20A-A9]MBU3628872.1 hypothetical protein [Polynucleobacter sp. AP-Reno-20A-A9]
MNCPFCGALLDSTIMLHQCTHCGASIFYGIEGYSKSHADSLLQAEAMQSRLKHEQEAEKEQKELFSSTQYRDGIVRKQKKGHLQTILEATGMAALYASIFMVITSPLLYFLVQPRLLKSYSVVSLIAGSYLFYFLFGLAVFYVTSRSLSD